MKLNEIKLIESNHSKLLKQWMGSGEAFRDDPDDDEADLHSAVEAMESRIKEFGVDQYDYRIQDVAIKHLRHIQDAVEVQNNSLEYMAKEHKKDYYKKLTRKHDVLPILLDPDLTILDGYHRTESSKLNDSYTVPALVPIKSGTGKVLNAEKYIES